MFGCAAQKTGMGVGVDQARHQHRIPDTFDRDRRRGRRQELTPVDGENAAIRDVNSSIGDDAILLIHGEQKVAGENEFGAGHVKPCLSALTSPRRLAECRMKSAARSPIMVTGAWVLQLGMIGITEASAIRNPSTPRTINRSSTTDMSSLPIFAVPQVWKNVEHAVRMKLTISVRLSCRSGAANPANQSA